MRYTIQKILFLVWMVLGPLALFASDFYLVTISNVKARSVGMGVAFMAVQDDLPALDLNPAAFSLTPFSNHAKTFSLYMNPMAPVLLGSNQVDLKDWDLYLGFLIKGFSFSLKRLNFGLIFGEEVLVNEERVNRKKWFKDSHYIHHRNTSFGVSLKFSPRVSVGFAGEFFTRERDEKKNLKMGYRYGLFLKPKPSISTSICFIDFPNNYGQDRLPLERLVDETLNIGLSYTPYPWLTMNVDIRNVSDEGKKAVREPHLGIEIKPLHHLSIRGGWFKNHDTEDNLFTAGLGLLDMNKFLPESRQFEHGSFVLNAAMVWQRDQTVTSKWFVLSTVIRY